MKKRKILLVHEKLGRFAGAEQNIFVTAPYLAETYELDIVYWTKTDREEALFSAPFTQKFQLDFDAQDAKIAQRIDEILEQSQPDLVYIHKCLSPAILESLQRHDISIVRMVHDHEVYCMRTYKYFPWSRKICTKKAGPCCLAPCGAFIARDRSKGPYGVSWVSYRQTQRRIRADRKIDASFVVTEFMREELVRQGYPEERIHIFPPVPLGLESPPPPPTFSDENILVFAGQILRGKGVDCMLRALQHVRCPFKLIILGDGSHRPYCEKLSRELGLEDRVEFKGFVPHETLKNFYMKATAGIVPSVWPEPIATWGLEVMRYALPVVGFDSGGIRDWLHDGQTGYLIPWMNVEAMGEKIEHLLTHKDEARRLGQKAQAFIEEHYHFGNYVRRLRDTLGDLMRV